MCVGDLVKLTDVDFQTMLDNVFTEHSLKPNNFDQAFIVHNAGTMGPIHKTARQMTSTKEVTEYYHCNVTSCVVLNSIFLQHFRKVNLKQTLIVNFSTLCALQPFKTWSLYCSGKKKVNFQSSHNYV